jgi:putative ATPase
MLEAGEDPVFVARRLVILASEDIGNADPHGLPLAVAATEAVRLVGMPEGRIPLAQATTYLASASKSNAAYAGINVALDDVRHGDHPRSPALVRNSRTDLMRSEGYGAGYRYAHDDAPEGMNDRYLPEELGIASTTSRARAGRRWRSKRGWTAGGRRGPRGSSGPTATLREGYRARLEQILA